MTIMTVMSLTTDFGQENGFVGVMKGVIWGIAPDAKISDITQVMKGVIWGIAPDAKISDITHDIPPQNVRLGAYSLWRVVPFFLPGSVHIAVADPGV